MGSQPMGTPRGVPMVYPLKTVILPENLNVALVVFWTKSVQNDTFLGPPGSQKWPLFGHPLKKTEKKWIKSGVKSNEFCLRPLKTGPKTCQKTGHFWDPRFCKNHQNHAKNRFLTGGLEIQNRCKLRGFWSGGGPIFGPKKHPKKVVFRPPKTQKHHSRPHLTVPEGV